jgi:hypothetical protein
MTVKLIDPRGSVRPRDLGLAPRGGSPGEGFHIGFLINESTRHQGPDFYGYTLAIESILRRRLQKLDVHRACKPVLSRPASDELLATYRTCSGVVSGLAK